MPRIVPLTKLRFMRSALLIGALLFVCSTLSAQHPWAGTFRNAGSDLAYTLNFEKNDSVCIRPFQAENMADSTLRALNTFFAVELEREVPRSVPVPMCQQQVPQIEVTGSAEPEGDRIRLQLDGRRRDGSTWSAVFFVENTSNLPEIGTLEDPFDQQFFEIPQLPAEGTVLRMNGQEIEGEIRSVDGIDVVMNAPRKRRKPKRLELHKSEIFSITFSTGEWVLYAPDPALGDDLTVDEMRVFIAGEQDARRGFKVWPTVAVGVAIGLAGAILADGGLLLTILPPLAYTAFQFVPVIKIQGASISNPEYKFNETYALGYERVARPKKLIGAFQGSGLGMIAGILTYFVALR